MLYPGDLCTKCHQNAPYVAPKPLLPLKKTGCRKCGAKGHMRRGLCQKHYTRLRRKELLEMNAKAVTER